MQRFKQISLIALLLGISPAAYAGSPADDVVMFPPVASSCVAGQMNILSWDGKNNVRCVTIPTCGAMQILSYNGTSFSCYPSGISGPLSGAPTAPFPPSMNVSNVTPAPLPSTIPKLPAGVTSASVSTSPSTSTASNSATGIGSVANGLAVIRGK